MVEGKVLYTDSTDLKANANKNNYVLKDVQKLTVEYLDALEKEVTKGREVHGKKPLAAKEQTPEVRETMISTTDPDSGYMMRQAKPEGVFYPRSSHR